ncbi:unnamed protein product, partial [Musa textilis]
ACRRQTLIARAIRRLVMAAAGRAGTSRRSGATGTPSGSTSGTTARRLELSRCSGAHVLEFLRYLDQFGKTKVHTAGCPFFGHPQPPAPCTCPLRQAWGSLDALVGRLRAAFEEDGGQPEVNPFAARAVRLYLREVRDSQAKARGIAYEKKKRKRPPPSQQGSSPQAPVPAAATAAPLIGHGRSAADFIASGAYPHRLHGHPMLPPWIPAETMRR